MSGSNALHLRFGSSVLWQAVATIALQGGTFLTNLAVANVLGAERFGQYGFLIGTAQAMASVLQLSTGIAASKYIAQYRTSEPALAAAALGYCSRISYGAGVGGTLLLLFFAFTFADRFDTFSAIGSALPIIAPIVFCSIVLGFQMGALAGLEGFKSSARVLLPLMIVQIAATTVAAHVFGIDGALWATLLSFALRTFVCASLLRKEAARNGISGTGGEHIFVRQMFFSFMLPGALIGLTSLPALWIASAALADAPNGFVQLGHFNAALSIRGVLMMAPLIATTVGFSLLNAHLGDSEVASFRKVLRINLMLSTGTAAIGAGIVLTFSHQLLSGFGPGFLDASTVLTALMISLIAEAFAWPLYQASASRGRMWMATCAVLLPRDLMFVAMSTYFVHAYGAMALAVAHVCGWVIGLIGSSILLVATRRANTPSAEVHKCVE